MDNLGKLYETKDLAIMNSAEDARMPGKNRVEELINFARKSGIRRIGIANCISMQKETDILKSKLAKDFEVVSIDCKIDKIPSSVLLNREVKGISCNPARQAEYLAEHKTELNVSFGLCIGHDIIFNQKSIAPVTTLVIKDREFKHNTYKYFEIDHEKNDNH